MKCKFLTWAEFIHRKLHININLGFFFIGKVKWGWKDLVASREKKNFKITLEIG